MHHLLETTKRSEDILRTEIKAVRDKQDKVDRLLQLGTTGIGQTGQKTLDKTSPTTIIAAKQVE